MEPVPWAVGVNVERPSAARVYDYYLGGFHNFAVDRAVAERTLAIAPEFRAGAIANRAFLRRAVRYCAGQGVRQFLDIGSGIPTAGNVHEVAQGVAAGCRVVYVDVDPVAVAHSRIIVEGNERVAVVRADARHPEQILADPALAGLLDLSEPVALLMVAVLHFLPDVDDPRGMIARYRDAMAPGSFLVVSHASDDDLPPRQARAYEALRRMMGQIALRSREQVAALFDGFDLVDPGLVDIARWRSEPATDAGDGTTGYAGVGRR